MINGAFMEDLSELLNSATGDERRRRTFYEIDTKFEKNDIVSTQELRQHAVVDALSSRKSTSDNDPGKDKDGWKKADEHLTVLMDQEHMITLEDTDAAVRRCEQHLERAAIDAASPKAKVLATEVLAPDNTAIEFAALKATVKAQSPQVKALSAQLRSDTSDAKRARNGAPVERNLFQCALFDSVCGKRGHNATDCWDKLDADQAKLDAAKAVRDKKKAERAN